MKSPRSTAFLLAALVGILAFTPSRAAAESPRIRVYAVTQEGAVPIDLNERKSSKKYSGQTLYLESAVPASARTQPTPKPKPTPKPRPKPKVEKPKPAPPQPAPMAAPITITKKAPEPKKVPEPKKAPPTPAKKSTPAPAPAPAEEDWDEYGDMPTIADPIEPVNRGIFWVNHQLYNFVVRPVSKVYTTIFPKPVRRAVNNAYDNAEYPVRLTNHLLQADIKNADLETRKFLVNSVAGVGGILKVSDRIPAIADVPDNDTGRTFAKWGIGHGPYIVWPILGPRSLRDTVGFAGDIVLSPFTWVAFAGAAPAIALSVTTPNTVRNANNRLDVYDAATKEAVDPYLAVRSGYIQNRDKPRKP
jgi:phospholipid-binding lipoprotein MlaA